MGNTSKFKNTSHFGQQWSFLDLPASSRILVQSKTTSILGEYHHIKIDSSSNLQKEMHLYNLRQSSRSGFLVNILGSYCGETRRFQSVNSLSIITERIPYRLSDIQNLSTQQALFVAYAIICGASQLYNHIRQYFQIQEQMIGINYFGVPKIWHRTEFEHNKLKMKENLNFYNEYDMIQNILRIVENKIKYKSELPKQFMQFKAGRSINFNGAIQIMNRSKNQYAYNEIRKKMMLRFFNCMPLAEKVPAYVLKSLRITNQSSKRANLQAQKNRESLRRMRNSMVINLNYPNHAMVLNPQEQQLLTQKQFIPSREKQHYQNDFLQFSKNIRMVKRNAPQQNYKEQILLSKPSPNVKSYSSILPLNQNILTRKGSQAYMANLEGAQNLRRSSIFY